MRRDSSRPGPGRWAVPVVLLAVLAACGAEQVTEPPPPGGNGTPPDPSVAGYIGGLPSWSTFAPDTIPEQNPTATSTPPTALPDTVVTDTLGDDGSTRYPIPPVTYACQIQEYSMAKTPREIVMYSPDTDILWPGALIQGKSHKDPLGSLLGLTISQRTPINVSIPELAGGNNFRTVDSPNQATVANGRADLIWNHLDTENKTYFGVAQAGGGFAFPGVRVHPNMVWSSYRLAVADADGDGDDDLVWSHSNGRRLYVGLSDGNNGLSFPAYQEHPAGGSGSPFFLVGNFDGAFGDDLVWNRLGSSNDAYVATSDGQGAYSLLSTTYATAGGWGSYKPFVGNVDNKNGDDLVWFISGDNNAGRVTRIYVRPATGGGAFSGTLNTQDPNPTDPDVNDGPFETVVGDFNGDGRADIMWNELSSVNRSFVGLGLGTARFDFSPQRQEHSGTEN